MKTFVQPTSLQSYYELINSNRIPDKRKRILAIFTANQPMTNLELSRGNYIPINEVTPRTNELVKMGLIESKGTKFDVLTGKRSIIWGIVIR